MKTHVIRTLEPAQAWLSLKKSDWNEGAARHLLRRIGFSVRPDALKIALEEGLGPAIRQAFAGARVMKPTESLLEVAEGYRNLRQRQKDLPEKERRKLRQAMNRKRRASMEEITINWLKNASEAQNSAFEKWGLFWENLFVVTAQKVKTPVMLYQYQTTLRRHSFKTLAELAKAVSRDPAMVLFLDLQQNKKGSPNENFARELFELFLLGEGNNTEKDITEAARAFTGYRQVNGQFRFIPNQHDDTRKTVFGKTGNWTGDDIVDLALQEPAARTFIPRELCKHYLSDQIIPDEYLQTLGDVWAERNFNLTWLASTFFSSRLFFHPQFRGNKIKSPFEFLIGLLQDLDLDLAPLPRRVIPALGGMGQNYLNPPNVRGWVGGKLWINSATIIQRRLMVEGLFNPPPSKNLNSDEVMALDQARETGQGRFFVTRRQGETWAGLPPEERLERMEKQWLANPLEEGERKSLIQFLRDNQSSPLPATRAVAITLLQSPQYQLV
ncbi:MAG: DUF1800 family protein [Opitutae bacterium]|nr:DUF1800 family protein [Opitutae bacterium]